MSARPAPVFHSQEVRVVERRKRCEHGVQFLVSCEQCAAEWYRSHGARLQIEPVPELEARRPLLESLLSRANKSETGEARWYWARHYIRLHNLCWAADARDGLLP